MSSFHFWESNITECGEKRMHVFNGMFLCDDFNALNDICGLVFDG